jgi:23S rRNA (adenine2503-C2)-methyltransferase
MVGVDLDVLQSTLDSLGEPRFRFDQVWSWAARGASSYDDMTNVPASLRAALAERVPFSTLSVEHEATARDGTVKALFRTADGRPVEAVLMRYRDGRRSICVSSQSGCPLTCTFCATGAMKFGRNLTASEILDQVLHFRRIEDVNHLVFMGIERLSDVRMPVGLALSLHAPEEALRSTIMPVNDRYPMADVLAACRRHFEATNRTVSIEYVMLAGVNDTVAQARELAALLGPGRAFKVNLIPYNPSGSVYEGSGREAIAAFRAVLEEHGVRATVRLTRGRDIDAACGQLAARAAASAPPVAPSAVVS